jgi:hypothetical protein
MGGGAQVDEALGLGWDGHVSGDPSGREAIGGEASVARW